MKTMLPPPHKRKPVLNRLSNHDVGRVQGIIKLLLVMLIPFFGYTSFAQTDFITEFQQEQTYYDSLISALGSDSMQGTGYTQFQRRYRYWGPKLSANYDFDDYQADLLDYAHHYTYNEETNNTITWHLVGPNDVPEIGFAAKGTGQIHYILKDPHDLTGNTVYACSPVGGLFRSLNNGDAWENVGTDKGMPRPGVSSVVVDSRSATTLYISTGNGEGFVGEKAWQTAIGVWRSVDDGENWTNIGLDYGTNGYYYHMRKLIEIKNNTDSTHLIVTTTKGLYQTKNANASAPVWDVLIPGEFYDVVQDINNKNIVYASGSNSTGIYKYNLDNNDSIKIFDIDTITFPYDTMELTLPETRRISLKIPSANSDYLFAVVSMKAYNYTAIYRYEISTGIWHKFFAQANFNGYGRKLGWAIRPDTIGELQILGRDVEQLFQFSNGLSNDSCVILSVIKAENEAPHHDTHFLWVEENNQTIWAGTDGGVYKGRFINDSTIYWESKNYGLGVATVEFIDVFRDQFNIKEFVTSGQFDCGSNTYRSDNGIDWSIREVSHGDGYQNIILTENHYYVSHQLGGYVEYDPLINFKTMGSYPSCLTSDTVPYANWDTYYVNVDTILYAAGTKEVIKYYNGGWHEWSDLESQIGCDSSATWRVAAKKKSNGAHQIYASARQEDPEYHYIYKSIDGGGPHVSKWIKVNNTPAKGWISSMAITDNTDSVIVSIRTKLYSVNTTDPSHPVWYDISYDLEAGNINSIFLKGTTTWLATEHGVYYREEGSPTWINYTFNLPNCEVKDIKVTNNRKVYVGTYGRGVWYASTPGCGNVENDYHTSPGYSIGSGFTRNFYSDIIVDSGNTFPIYGTLKMAADCKIIVEQGAKLVVDGGTITNACPDLWDGIEVWGNSNSVQDTVNQGWVILKNGATIQYAKTGITVGKDGSSIANLDFTGGVIQAEDAYFKNNTKSIVLLPYPHIEYRFSLADNKSYFKNCTFTYDSTYYFFNDSPRRHVELTDVRGVLFEGNLFENTVSPLFAAGDKRGSGIASSQSGFKVILSTESEKRNTFSGLNYGISGYDIVLSNKPIIIDQAIFNNNRTGCYFGASTFVSVTNCVFNATFFLKVLPGDLYSGLYLDNCTGYQVEENTFSSDYSPMQPNDYKSVGLVVNNSGPEDNLVYNNNFRNLLWATQAQGINRSKEGTGLTIKCNDYQNNYQDISVTASEHGEVNGVRYYQGSNTSSVNAPAGNTFSHLNNNGNIYSDYLNNEFCGDIIYWHHYPFTTNEYVVPVYATPAPDFIKQNNPYNLTYGKTTACPSTLTGHTKSTIIESILSSTSSEEIYVDSLNILIDNGNTTSLVLDVATSIPPETMLLRDQLLASSPYLSDTVMVSAAEKEDVLPNSIITEVLTANPQSATASNVLSTLDSRSNPLSDIEMASIHANDTIVGHKKSLESKKAFYAGKKANSVYELARVFMNDSSLTSYNDSIRQALTHIHTPLSHYFQAFCHFNSDDSLGVVTALNSIPSEFNLSSEEINNQVFFEEYFDKLLQLKTEGRTVYDIDSIEKATMHSIMNNTSGLLHAYARNLLVLTDELVYHEPYIFPDTSSNKSTEIIEMRYAPIWSVSSFKLYPNPTKDYITIEYKLANEFSNAIVEVVSIGGVLINTFRLFNSSGEDIIDLRGWKSGTYVLKLVVDGKTIQSDKFVKQ